jgi:hypothetical protein
MAKVRLQSNIERDGTEIAVFIENQFEPGVRASIIRQALVEASKQFAEKWLEENKDKIIERLNVDAIANMVLLEVAKQTRDDIVGKDRKD